LLRHEDRVSFPFHEHTMTPFRPFNLMRIAALAGLLAMTHIPVGAAPPDLLDVGQWKGKVVVLDFWASWCGPCKESFPWMKRLQDVNAVDGLVVVAVNLDHDRELAERFIRNQRPNFPIVFDPEGRIAEQFEVKSMPASFYLDRAGRIRYGHAGFRRADTKESENELAKLLAER